MTLSERLKETRLGIQNEQTFLRLLTDLFLIFYFSRVSLKFDFSLK